MLLTSTQVSVAVSSGVVFVCTTALFLSGYAIQQRTLRDLRESIKPGPRPSPKIFLPDRFKKTTTELEDGTVIVLEDDNNDNFGRGRGRNRGGRNRQVVVEIKPTLSEDATNTNAKVNTPNQQRPIIQTPDGPLPPTRTVRRPQQKPRPQPAENDTQPPAPADNVNSNYDLVDEPDPEKPQKQISRAERRRRIKEEIQRLATGGGERGYYQRRLW
ncbi:hypothetical protein B0T25DRAFT_527504 [Lasiosphaeria hispida]|uniref:Uncharacterized protein n=1 Tax=Lasiosphaeria hispida TaxID=260671 RepID=A0AAJ0MKD1_9PEZI|nr:hypothetical protein B0T25DRAFT_527504 [Lasiosphaeria hispida]